jgi:cell division protein FtsQ
VALASAGVLVGATFGALHSPVFEVRRVEVFGNAHTPKALIERAAGLSRGSLMISAGSARAVRAVDALPWVASVSFERRWPWTLVLKVTERRPAALVPGRGSADVVDATGRVLETVRLGAQSPVLPVVTGATQAEPGQRVAAVAPTTGTGLSLLLEAASTTPGPLAARHLVLTWSPSLGLEARVGAFPATVLLGDGSELAYKMAVLTELAERVQLASYSLVDLTVPQRPALTPVTGA